MERNTKPTSKPESVPYIVHEAEIARQERHIKRLWVALIVAIVACVAITGGFLWYLNQYDFTSYEQDGHTRNGAEPIRWIVLDIRDSGLFLISEKGLEKAQFHSHNDKTGWAGSDVRRWLNNTFLATAFSSSQQAAIQDTQVDNSAAQHNPDVNKAGREGEPTTDKVFLLSYKEVLDYLMGQDRIYCVPTQTAQTHGVNKSDKTYYNGQRTTWYWLRSPAYSSNANVVDWNGKVETCIMSHNRGTVRPALWVNISAVSR